MRLTRHPDETWDDAEERAARDADKWYDARADRQFFSQPPTFKSMGMTKNYLLKIQEYCSDQQFGQDAIEWAILSGHVRLTGDLETDLRNIMGEPGKPETGQYDEICEAYRAECRKNEGVLVETYQASGLLEEILRPVPLTKSA